MNEDMKNIEDIFVLSSKYPGAKVVINVSVNIKGTSDKPNKNELVCSECQTEIDEKTNGYSIKVYKKALCRACQSSNKSK